MSHGLLWLPLLLVFVLLTALGWLERRRQTQGCGQGIDAHKPKVFWLGHFVAVGHATGRGRVAAVRQSRHGSAGGQPPHMEPGIGRKYRLARLSQGLGDSYLRHGRA